MTVLLRPNPTQRFALARTGFEPTRTTLTLLDVWRGFLFASGITLACCDDGNEIDRATNGEALSDEFDDENEFDEVEKDESDEYDVTG